MYDRVYKNYMPRKKTVVRTVTLLLCSNISKPFEKVYFAFIHVSYFNLGRNRIKKSSNTNKIVYAVEIIWWIICIIICNKMNSCCNCVKQKITYDMIWWRHRMETFSTLLPLCAGNSPVTGEFPARRPAPRSSVVFFDLLLNKQLSKQSSGWWFETQSR